MMKTKILLKIVYLTAIISILFSTQLCLGNNSVANQPARYIFGSTQDGDNVVKILLYYDMEGISGQNILTSIDFPRPEYFEARELLTADVNAVIDGLFDGGADSLFVVDAHGSFNPEPDILLDKMDKRAQMLFKKEKFQPYVDLLNENSYDGIVAVAMHSKTGGGGFAEHTVNLGTDWILNGMSINESELLAYSWGRNGIPLIFVSGDDKLAEQLSWMTWLEYVTVKEARGMADAFLYPVDSVQKNLREAAKNSVKNLKSMKSIRLSVPITATLKVIPPSDLSILEKVPGIDYHNQSVTFQANDFMETYNGMRGLMDVAQSGLYNIAAEILFGQGQESFMSFKDGIFESWKSSGMEDEEIEQPSEPSVSKEEKLYFGSK